MPKKFKDERGSLDIRTSPSGVARICFGHPSHNAFPSSQLFALAELLTKAGKEPGVRVILLQSSGARTFCAGASFDELLSLSDAQEATRFFSGFAAVLNAMRTCQRLIVGQIQGKAIGGGAGLAAACDYAFATRHAEIRLSELSLHIGPFVIEPALRRKIGIAAFSELSLNPGLYKSAAWAKDKGLFQEVYDSLEEMQEAATAFCENLATYSLPALMELKSMFWQGTEHWATLLEQRAGISGRLVLQQEARSHLEQFKNKR